MARWTPAGLLSHSTVAAAAALVGNAGQVVLDVGLKLSLWSDSGDDVDIVANVPSHGLPKDAWLSNTRDSLESWQRLPATSSAADEVSPVATS